MRDAVICMPRRTPVGDFGGRLRDLPAVDLAAAVIRDVIQRSGIPPEGVDDVVLGQGYPSGEAPSIGRVAALDAGLPVSVPGVQLDRRCGSGLQAVLYAAMCVQTGAFDLVIAGGAESMSQVEHYAIATRWGARAGDIVLFDRLKRSRVTAGGRLYPVPGGMIETAENLRRRYGISRARQDMVALRSHQRAITADASGLFFAEIVPIEVTTRGETVRVEHDEHPRPDATNEILSRLKPVMLDQDPEATVTAGNASGQNDGAAACIVTHPDRAADLGLRPIARLRSWSVTGVEPGSMGIGPVSATRRALEHAGLALADIDLIELNEAFAVQVLACTSEWGLDDEDPRMNVHGSGISLGHPIGATGARILTTLLHEMDRREVDFGLETMCIGGGQGIAAVFERLE